MKDEASSAREHIINLPHDPFCPLNRSGHQRLGSRVGIEEIGSSFHSGGVFTGVDARL
jgi:hypothetical protein